MTRLVDLILCLVVLEGTVLTMLYRIAGIGVQPRMALQTLAAGFLLLLALRLALSGAPWFALCGCGRSLDPLEAPAGRAGLMLRGSHENRVLCQRGMRTSRHEAD